MTELVAQGVGKSVLSILESQGLPLRKNLDIDVPKFPVDITAVDDQELMILATKYMENYNFIRTQVALAALAEMEAENIYTTAEAKALLSKSNGKSTEKATMLKSAVITDPEIESLNLAKMHTYAYRKMLETMQDNLERYYNLTSRELTRRTSANRNRF
jgi:hypothetical protein